MHEQCNQNHSVVEKDRVPWVIEHPRSSRAWYLPFFRQLVKRKHIIVCDMDQCQYGTRWRKSTRLICSRIDACSAPRLQSKCHKDSKGNCSKTHKPHIQLRGTHPSGVPWTSVAASYPKQMAKHVAFCLLEPYLYKYPYVKTLSNQ